MLCEVGTSHGFIALWIVMSILGLTSMLLLSSALFYPYYVHPTFDRWKYKNNPKFPSPELVKKEIIHMCKGILWIRSRKRVPSLSPAVIADEYLDQFVRTLPMVILPFVLPINMDLMFAVFAILFYGYGVYLHWGYETPYLTAHNPILNTSYHHYTHHALSAKGRAIYTGFFFKAWDAIFSTGLDGPCTCFQCRPERTLQMWKNTVRPDYSVLLSPGWWLSSSSAAGVSLDSKAD